MDSQDFEATSAVSNHTLKDIIVKVEEDIFQTYELIEELATQDHQVPKDHITWLTMSVQNLELAIGLLKDRL